MATNVDTGPHYHVVWLSERGQEVIAWAHNADDAWYAAHNHRLYLRSVGDDTRVLVFPCSVADCEVMHG